MAGETIPSATKPRRQELSDSIESRTALQVDQNEQVTLNIVMQETLKLFREGAFDNQGRGAKSVAKELISLKEYTATDLAKAALIQMRYAQGPQESWFFFVLVSYLDSEVLMAYFRLSGAESQSLMEKEKRKARVEVADILSLYEEGRENQIDPVAVAREICMDEEVSPPWVAVMILEAVMSPEMDLGRKRFLLDVAGGFIAIGALHPEYNKRLIAAIENRSRALAFEVAAELEAQNKSNGKDAAGQYLEKDAYVPLNAKARQAPHNKEQEVDAEPVFRELKTRADLCMTMLEKGSPSRDSFVLETVQALMQQYRADTKQHELAGMLIMLYGMVNQDVRDIHAFVTKAGGSWKEAEMAASLLYPQVEKKRSKPEVRSNYAANATHQVM